MLFTGKMSYIQTVVLERDFQKAVDLLGDSGWVELKRSESDRKEQLLKLYEIIEDTEKKINGISEFFELPQNNDNGSLKNVSDIADYINVLHDKIRPYRERLSGLIAKKRNIENNIKDIEQFKNLNISIEEMNNFQFVHSFSGSMTRESAEIIKSKLGARVVVAEIEKDFYILFASRKGRWSLESELKKVNFQEKKIETKSNGLPTELFANLNKELEDVEKEISEINEFKESLFKKEGREITNFLMSFNLQKIYQGVYQTIQHGESITLFEGWILTKKVNALVKQLKDALGEHFSFVSYDADELEDVKNGTLKVPVQLENIKPLKPFESLIYTYGIPSYKSFDPTILFTLSFLLFFGIMFGDMGQGVVIFIVGLFVARFTKLKDLGYVIACSGIMAVIFGFLYGSFFCFEHHEIEGLFMPLYSFFGFDTPYILFVSQSNIMQVFLIVIFLGMSINLTGMLLNIINGIVKKRLVSVLFAANGLAGFMLLFSGAIFALSFALPGFFDINFTLTPVMMYTIFAVIGISMIFIFFKDPLVNIIKHHKPVFHGGIVMGLFFCFVELFEAVLTTISNNLSFIRLGAFALSHAILSSTILLFVEMAGGPKSIGGIIVLIFGNAIIIGLEGMIVMIQTIRLEYYEFFSKFFNEFGKQFIPFKIDKRKIGVQ